MGISGSLLKDGALGVNPDDSLRILVVDDEPASREVITRYLCNDGHRVSSAAGGPEAMDRVMEEDFDLVIADLGLPGMDSLQLADAVRLTDREKAIILVTGFSFSPDRQTKSVSRVLQKPLGPDDLRCALHEMARR